MFSLAASIIQVSYSSFPIPPGSIGFQQDLNSDYYQAAKVFFYQRHTVKGCENLELVNRSSLDLNHWVSESYKRL